MSVLDWAILIAYFGVMVWIGVWARRRIHNSRDFFTAGGRMPWWLSGISHHMSGYSAAVFVGYAAIAYNKGFVLYIWWALGISFALAVGAVLFAPRWARLRQRRGIISPLEWLVGRYGRPTQQLLAWSGTALKVFDVAAKWAATAILLHTFAGVPLAWGVLITGGVTLVYSTIGGLWADALTDFGQFLIQLVTGVTLFGVTLAKLGGLSSIWTMWDRLPASHHALTSSPYTTTFILVYLLINVLSYNGGTWNLAQRFIAAPTGSSARRAALLSMSLYLVWPLILFFPMWAAPLLYPHLADPQTSYAVLAQGLLPSGLIGLVLAGMFSHTMAMTSSDANAIASVVTRDILPGLWRGARAVSEKTELAIGRAAVLVFIAASMVIALVANSFGGVLGLLITWFGALVGPIAIPMLLGMLPVFRRSGQRAAIASWVVGIGTFVVVKYLLAGWVGGLAADTQTVATVASPVLAALLVYTLVGVVAPERNRTTDELLDSLSSDLSPEEAAVLEPVDGGVPIR
jgi:solute:Na+ symporter, SSS family